MISFVWFVVYIVFSFFAYTTGLKAAENFIGQFSDDLEKLDFSSLLEFPPLHDAFHNKDFTVIEYLRQAPPQEMRLFIWTLEEYREHYPSLFTILDDYFEMGM